MALIGCGKKEKTDAADPQYPETTMYINGKKMTVITILTKDGYWMDGLGKFTISVKDGDFYDFRFLHQSGDMKVGDDLSTMDLVYKDGFIYEYNYSSGSAVISKCDKTNEIMYIDFKELTMIYKDEYSDDSTKCVFNGPAVVSYSWNYNR